MRSCLVIDDSPVIRKVASRIVATFGFEVIGAAAAAEALEIAASEVPDLVMVAGAVGDMPAERVVRELRALPGGPEATILALLVESNLGHMTRLKRAGVDGFAFKPFDRESLARCLEPYIEARRAA